MVKLVTESTSYIGEQMDDVEIALLPVGAVEQHGPALPLGTDTLTATAIAESVTDREDTLLLPSVPVGISKHHRQFHGTLWVSADTLERYVREIVEGIASHGVEKVVFVNGHGGNADTLKRLGIDLRAERTAFAPTWVWTDSLDGLRDELFGGYGGHADEVEASIMMYLDESYVDRDELESAEAGAPPTWGKSVHGANVGLDTPDITETGSTGTPTNASVEAGEELFERARAELEALLDWLAAREQADLWAPPHR
jgi:creatinine amidohydrolase